MCEKDILYIFLRVTDVFIVIIRRSVTELQELSGEISFIGTNTEPLRPCSSKGERELICLSVHSLGEQCREKRANGYGSRLGVQYIRENHPPISRGTNTPSHVVSTIIIIHPSTLFSHGFTPDSERPRWIKDFPPVSRGPTTARRR